MAATWLDRTLALVAPKVAGNMVRERERFFNEHVSGKRSAFDAADKGRRTGGWRTVSTGSKAFTSDANLSLLRDRSRALIINNPHAKKAQGVYSGNVIGTGLTPRFMFNGQSKSPRAKALAKVWTDWERKADADGLLTFSALCALAMETVPASGEVLIRRKWRDSSDGLPVPFQIQILEPDFIDASKDSLKADADGNFTVQGIKYNKKLQRVGYWLFKRHPGDGTGGGGSDLYPAEDIIHMFKPERAGQVRGIPWYATIILRLRDFADFEDAQLVRQKIAACFTVFITDADMPAPSPGSANKAPPKLPDALEPGLIEFTPPGRDVKFANPPGVEGYGEYALISLRAIAAGLQLPYEALTGDLSKVNFSSGRMGWLEFQRQISQWQWNMVIPMMCEKVMQWYLEAAQLQGLKTDGVTVDWTVPRREMIDPVSETRAMGLAVRMGFMSLPEAIRQLGDDPEKVLQEIADTNKLLDKLGIIVDSDPRKTTQAGLGQAVDEPPADPVNSGDNNE